MNNRGEETGRKEATTIIRASRGVDQGNALVWPALLLPATLQWTSREENQCPQHAIMDSVLVD